ncbi:MAG: HPr family phosphocarrier protein [Oscillospiraceae bacterium]|nr:HPr family phosphocarrier protein [Oscillospiraceae bacterium]
MRSFRYIVEDERGIHARPAGQLSKLAKEYLDTVITVTKDGKTARTTQLMRLMNLGVKCGDEVTVAAEGFREDEAIAAVQKFFQDNL